MIINTIMLVHRPTYVPVITSELKKQCWLAQSDQIDGKCYRCLTGIDVFDYSVRRIINLKNGGSTELSNLVPVCKTCSTKLNSINIVCTKPTLLLTNTPSCRFVHTMGPVTEVIERQIQIDNRTKCVIKREPEGFVVYCTSDGESITNFMISYDNNIIRFNRKQLVNVAKHIKSRNPEPIMLGGIEFTIGRDGNTQARFEDGSTIWGPTDDELLDKLVRL